MGSTYIHEESYHFGEHSYDLEGFTIKDEKPVTKSGIGEIY